MTDACFTFPTQKVITAAEKIIDDCRRQNFTIREFIQLIGELSLQLEDSRKSIEAERRI